MNISELDPKVQNVVLDALKVVKEADDLRTVLCGAPVFKTADALRSSVTALLGQSVQPANRLELRQALARP